MFDSGFFRFVGVESALVHAVKDPDAIWILNVNKPAFCFQDVGSVGAVFCAGRDDPGDGNRGGFRLLRGDVQAAPAFIEGIRPWLANEFVGEVGGVQLSHAEQEDKEAGGRSHCKSGLNYGYQKLS